MPKLVGDALVYNFGLSSGIPIAVLGDRLTLTNAKPLDDEAKVFKLVWERQLWRRILSTTQSQRRSI
ncbi:hypothetical protein [Phormidium tenue]|uniref:hypothetical protein n=1 Tax=Phormidium tenue TaxID=126344 RepID=UPI0011152869|nr:hypothetical protein [Phormidium tenue]MBD2233261.1 hypothetical protein [Phormidium tenue FACHB-1052]